MASVSRESVMVALFARLKAMKDAGLFVTVSRRLKSFDDVPAQNQPALFMSEISQSFTQRNGYPRVLEMKVELYVYAQSNAVPDDESSPGSVMNPLLDAIEAALAPDDTEGRRVCTLGGLVHHCWIEGDTREDEGVLGQQAIRVLTLSVLFP